MEMEKLFNELKQGDPQKKGEEPKYQGPLGMAFTVGYARVSSQDQKAQLEPQANRIWAYAGQTGIKTHEAGAPTSASSPSQEN